MSCFIGQNPCLPVYKGETQSRNLGMAVEVWDEEGAASLALFLPVTGVSGDGKLWHVPLLGVSSPVTCRLMSLCPGLPVPSPGSLPT